MRLLFSMIKNIFILLFLVSALIASEVIDKEQALSRFSSKIRNARPYESLDAKLRKDKDIVIAFVSSYDHALEFVVKNMKYTNFAKDKDVVLAAVKYSYYALEYADESLKKDKEIVLASVKHYGNSIEYASSDLKKDDEVVMAAIRSGGSLYFADEPFKKNRKAVYESVKRRGYTITHADPMYLKDKEMVLLSLQTDSFVFRYKEKGLELDPKLRKDREVVLAAVKIDGETLNYIDSSFYDDKEVISLAVQNKPSMLKLASKRLKDDIEVVNHALKKDIFSIRYASKRLRSSVEFMRPLIKENGYVLLYASKNLQENEELKTLANKTGNLSKFINKEEDRKENTIAWNEYSVDNAIENLYGNIELLDTNLTSIKTNSVASNGSMTRFSVLTKIKIKSFAVFQDVLGKKSLVSYFVTPCSLKDSSYMLTLTAAENFVIVVEGVDGNFYIKRKSVSIRRTGCFDNDIDYSISKETYEALKLDNDIKKIKAKSRRGQTDVRILLNTPMLTYKKAKEFGVKTKYIAKMEVKIEGITQLTAYLSQYFHHRPMLKFKFDGEYRGKNLELYFTNAQGLSWIEKVKIK